MPGAPTIFALSSAPGRAGVAIVRVSGPAAGAVLDQIAPPRPLPRAVSLRRFLHPATGETLDRGLALWFPAPASFTGEDAAELQGHGGRAVTAALVLAIGAVPGCRLAEPGEFARRAFENGKIDLAEAEGLADLIEAETEAQRRQALHHAGGVLSTLYDGWRRKIIGATALVEAAIDFSDEADVGAVAVERAGQAACDLAEAIGRHLDDGHRGEILRTGFRVVLAGPPNSGKSSLMNALARRDVAIVSEEAGTTRDVIEVRLDLEGLPVILSDTAGIRETAARIEQEGVRRALAEARGADLVLWLGDAIAPQAELPENLPAGGANVIHVQTKIDLLGDGATRREAAPVPTASGVTAAISAKTGQGLDALVRILADFARERVGTGEEPAIAHARHRTLLEQAHGALTAFVRETEGPLELRAEELRLASSALGRITGRVDPEEVLGQVFQRFCIGK